MTEQSINLPAHPSISPRHLPTTHTHSDTHTLVLFHCNTPATLYPNRGGLDELPQKSYGCFAPRDFRPCPSGFMFLLFFVLVGTFSKFKSDQTSQAATNFYFLSKSLHLCCCASYILLVSLYRCQHINLNANQSVEVSQMLILLIDRPV